MFLFCTFSQTSLLVNVCNALAKGLLQPWTPAVVPKQQVVPFAPTVQSIKADEETKGAPKKGGKAGASNRCLSSNT